jgi:sugar lactone lactonase YvrE
VGLAIDEHDRLYVGEAGLGSTPGQKVYRFLPDGTRSLYADFSGGPVVLFALAGLTLDPVGNLYVANYVDGRVAKVDPRGVQTLAGEVPGPFSNGFSLSNLAWAHGRIYATVLFGNTVYQIDPDGSATLLAGTGAAGTLDGPVARAQLNGPNGIAVAPEREGSVLLVSQLGDGALRRITLRER